MDNISSSNNNKNKDREKRIKEFEKFVDARMNSDMSKDLGDIYELLKDISNSIYTIANKDDRYDPFIFLIAIEIFRRSTLDAAINPNGAVKDNKYVDFNFVERKRLESNIKKLADIYLTCIDSPIIRDLDLEKVVVPKTEDDDEKGSDNSGLLPPYK